MFEMIEQIFWNIERLKILFESSSNILEYSTKIIFIIVKTLSVLNQGLEPQNDNSLRCY